MAQQIQKLSSNPDKAVWPLPPRTYMAEKKKNLPNVILCRSDLFMCAMIHV